MEREGSIKFLGPQEIRWGVEMFRKTVGQREVGSEERMGKPLPRAITDSGCQGPCLLHQCSCGGWHPQEEIRLRLSKLSPPSPPDVT